MNKTFCFFFFAFFFLLKNIYAQLPPVFTSSQRKDVQSEETVRRLLSPVKILWETPNASTHIVNAARLLKQGNGQADLSGKDLCILHNDETGKAGLLLDFGKEIHGGLQLVTDQSRGGKPVRVRIRFG